MARRAALLLAAGAAWLGGATLGTAAAALGTARGRAIVIAAVTRFVNANINGTLTIGAVDGALLRGLSLSDVSLTGADGDPFLQARAVDLGYAPGDLLRRRFVLGHLRVDSLTVHLVQHQPGGPFNLDEIFPRSGGPAGRRPLVAFGDVQLRDAALTIHTPARRGDEGVVEALETADGYTRVRRVDAFQARLSYLRLSSPLARQAGIVMDVERLAARVTDPLLRILDVAGRVTILRDSLAMDLRKANLPGTEGTVRGTLAWGTDTLLVNVAAQARDLATDDLLGLAPDLPRGLEGSANVAVRSLSGGVLLVEADGLDLEALPGGGSVSGRFGMVFGPGDEWEQRRTDLTLERFDLERVRHLVDTLPVAGRVSGRVAANGPRRGFELRLDATFLDSLIPGWPHSSIAGAGRVALGVPGDFVFHQFRVERSDLSLVSVRRLIPAIALEGRLQGVGTVDGPWLEASWDGELRHRDSPRPETVARGPVRYDATGAVVGLWGTWTFDSLRVAGLAGSFPALDLAAALAGTVAFQGAVDSLEIDARLTGPAGAVAASGTVGFRDDRRGAYHLEVQVRNLDLASLDSTWPQTRINGAANGSGWIWLDRRASVRALAHFGPSTVNATALDTGLVQVLWADSLLALDTLELRGAHVGVTARGFLGTREQQGRITFQARTDSLGVLERWIAPLAGPLAPDASPPVGAVRVTGQLIGGMDAFVVSATVEADGVRRGDLALGALTGNAVWASASGGLQFEGRAASATLGPLTLDALEGAVRGFADSIEWSGRSRLGREGAWLGRGRLLQSAEERRLVLDSLAIRLPSGTWVFDPGFVTLNDSALVTPRLAAEQRGGPGRIEVEGRLPTRGPADLRASVVGLALQDIWLLLGRDHRNVSGEMNGTVRIEGLARAPRIEASVALTDAVIGNLRAPRTTGILRYADRRLTGELELRRAGVTVLEVHTSLPLDLSFTEVERRRLRGPISVRAVADSIDLSLLGAVTPYVRRAQGTLDADFGIGGTWEDPELTGRIAIRDGEAAFPALGVRHEGVNGTLVLSGDEIRVEQLTVRSGRGTARVTGAVRLEEISRPLLNLRIIARDFRALDIRGFLSLTGSGDLSLRGPVFGAMLTGRGTANRGVLYFADLITKEIVDLEDTLFEGLVDTTLLREEGLGSEFENRFLDSLRISNLELALGDDVWMRSTEANIQLRGAVTVGKEGDRYLINGTLETPRGTYRLDLAPTVTREFRVTRGQVRYFGTPDLNADLDIDAEHIVRAQRRENVTINVHIGGTLYEPRLRLTSNITPPISDAEIVSYLLFGAENVGTRESQQASEFVSERLYGVLSGQLESTFISDIGIPLDYLQIRPMARGGFFGGTTIDIGKQFNVFGTTAFLTASPLICPRQSSAVDLGASLEFRLSRRWLVAASVDPHRRCESFAAETTTRYQFGLDLFWETSY